MACSSGSMRALLLPSQRTDSIVSVSVLIPAMPALPGRIVNTN